MRLKVTDDFQVTWPTPADASITWLYDPMHFPLPAAPAMVGVVDPAFEKCFQARAAIANGYLFSTDLIFRPPTEEMMRRGVVSVWTEDFLPQIEAYASKIRQTPWTEMDAAQVAAGLKPLADEAARQFQFTIDVVLAFMGPGLMLAEWLEGQLGADGPRLGATLLQGYDNETSHAGAGLSGLAEQAAADPDLAAAIRDGRFDALPETEAGRAFVARFHDYLDAYGWRLESWGLLHQPTWAETPDIPLDLVRRYLIDPDHAPAAAIERSAGQRADARREIESRLPASEIQTFRQMADAAEAHVAMSEGRARWQLTILGVLRIPLLALGKKLAGTGVLSQPNDIVFLEWDELEGAAQSAEPLIARVAERRAEMERWQRLTPPPFLGAPPDFAAMPPETQLVMKHFFGLVEQPQPEAGVIRGIGASAGVVTGTARVLASVDEGDRLEPGDILVCITTAPPWTPLFSIAGGVVTDTGGVLCHSAICAREYAIPAVVGTQVATALIPDGARLTIDGAAGTVSIETPVPA